MSKDADNFWRGDAPACTELQGANPALPYGTAHGFGVVFDLRGQFLNCQRGVIL